MTDSDKIIELDSYIWRTNFKDAGIKQWRENFDSEDVTLAQKLLSQFLYFDDVMIREMLISLYRDLVIYPIKQQIIFNGIASNIEKEINKTRFLGMGNPSESGTFLLYYFRQINNINKNLFIDGSKVQLNNNDTEITRYIYIDDMSITGSQITNYATNEQHTITAKKIKDNNPDIEINCYLLFATDTALEKIKKLGIFDGVESIFELDGSFNCFSEDPSSRYLKTQNERSEVKTMLKKYMHNYKVGELEGNDRMFGFKEAGLLLGLNHNTPNNTLPIFWGEGPKWNPLFIRYGKNYAK